MDTWKEHGYMPLSVESLKKIRDNGFCYVEVKPMHFIKVTVHDLYVDKKDADKLLRNHSK
jgi:hypothetical protein